MTIFALANSGCSLSDSDQTYIVSTRSGDVVVTCEWFSHDWGYWEPTTKETYAFQWVCDALPDHGSFGLSPQTIVNPSDASEVARRR